jgi:asparagine synthase (glutamine-hydrolysing)
MIEAVRKRLVSDVPLGAFLSGGVDSTIVVGLMSRLMDRPVHTFSIGFRGADDFDETPFARLAATRFHSHHTEFLVEPKAFQLLERLVYHHDQPFGDASAIPTFLLCQLAKAHVTVALNGDGGDESFAGYRRFQAAVLSSHLPSWATAAAVGVLSRLPTAIRRQPRMREALRFCEAARLPWDQRLARWISYHWLPTDLLRPEVRDGVPADAWLLPVRRHLADVTGLSPLRQAMAFNFHEYLPNDLNVKMDRCSMAHGLETRSPFLDTAVIEFAAWLPDRMKLRGLDTKVILKEAFSDLLPEAIRHRRKQGFGVPLDRWFHTELREAVGELLLAPDARLSAYLDRAAIERLWQGHLEGTSSVGLQLWSLLTLEVWLRMLERGRLEAPEREATDLVAADAQRVTVRSAA